MVDQNQSDLERGAETIGRIAGYALAAMIDVAVFCGIAAIPLAALVVIGVISQATATALLGVVAILAGLAVLLRVIFLEQG
jgi:uncharacterized membrane protein (Fun14 family)